jgi:cytochrome bd-type quinol oxidase subunit 2
VARHAAEKNLYEISIPHLASLYLTHSWSGEVQGLKAVPPDNRPYVPIVFFAFRIMAGIGMILLGLAFTGAVLRLRGRLYDTPWFQYLVVAASPLDFVAVLAGWTVTETGRQPFVVYGLVRTADAASPVAPGAIATTLIGFLLIYGLLFAVFLWFATRLILKGSITALAHEISGHPWHRRSYAPMSVDPVRVSAPAERQMDAPLLFVLLAMFGIAVYVVADGFDLGVGILSLVVPIEADRDLMMASIEPVWDGNETWLVFEGTLLFAAFPVAYYVLLPAFYLPVILMLFALLFRGIAFSFRSQAGRSRLIWDLSFGGGSFVAAFAQGLVLGGFIGGVDMQDGMLHGGGIQLSKHPRNFVRIWTDRRLRAHGCRLAHLEDRWVSAGARSGNRPRRFDSDRGDDGDRECLHRLERSRDRGAWFSWPDIAGLAPVPLITLGVIVAALRSLWSEHEMRLFGLSIFILLLGFCGLAISLWPYIVTRVSRFKVALRIHKPFGSPA